jgi:hypothetical protein
MQNAVVEIYNLFSDVKPSRVVATGFLVRVPGGAILRRFGRDEIGARMCAALWNEEPTRAAALYGAP